MPFILRLVISFISLSLSFLVSALMHAFSVSVECPTYSRRFLHSGWWGFSAPHECCTLFNAFSLVHFSCSVTSNSLQPHEPQCTRLPCLSPTPWVHPKSCSLNRWSHPTISSSVIPFSSCPQSLSASESFPMSQLFTSGGQSIGVSGSASVLPVNTQDWSPLGWTGWISLLYKGLSRVFSNTTVQKHQFFSAKFSL